MASSGQESDRPGGAIPIFGAFIDRRERGEGRFIAGLRPGVFTPAPASAWDRWTLSPVVWQTSAWCRSRSTLAAVISTCGLDKAG